MIEKSRSMIIFVQFIKDFAVFFFIFFIYFLFFCSNQRLCSFTTISVAKMMRSIEVYSQNFSERENVYLFKLITNFLCLLPGKFWSNQKNVFAKLELFTLPLVEEYSWFQWRYFSFLVPFLCIHYGCWYSYFRPKNEIIPPNVNEFFH